jgi:hypothetical protein
MTRRRERGKAKELDPSKYMENSAEFNVGWSDVYAIKR